MDYEAGHPIALEAIKHVLDKKKSWEDATCFVTDKVAFKMRDLIKQLRKNYFGIFDNPTDSVTGRDKIWIPLTESVVDAIVKNIDLDTKDINFRAKKAEARGMTNIVRATVKNYLDNMFFGEYLDELERTIAIDGTAVWKTFEESGEYEGKTMCIEDVDLLNFFIEPTAKSIQKTDGVIERGLMTPSAIRRMTGWFNTKGVQGYSGLSLNDTTLGIPSSGSMADTKKAEIYEYWGEMPKYLLTGVLADKEEMVKGHIVISNLERAPIVHLIEKMKNEFKPYEECWYSKVRGRWYGRGPAEKVMMLQLWLNIIVNIRINRSYVSQLGIFKIKRGSGITPQMVSKLTVNGGLLVKDMQDIEQFVVSDSSPSSYNDENVINTWSQRVTSLFEAVTGESMPSTTTATNGVISNRSASSQFVFVKKGVGMFLQRWIKRHVFPILASQITKEEVIRVTGEIEELRDMDERIANELLYKRLRQIHTEGGYFGAMQVEKERQRIMAKLQAMGNDRYIKTMKSINLGDYDVQVYVTNEEADKGVLIQNLVQMLQTLPNLQNSGIDPLAVANAVFDLMGIDTTQLRMKRVSPSPAPAQPMPQGGSSPMQGSPVATAQEAVTAAATL